MQTITYVQLHTFGYVTWFIRTHLHKGLFSVGYWDVSLMYKILLQTKLIYKGLSPLFRNGTQDDDTLRKTGGKDKPMEENDPSPSLCLVLLDLF